ncbi:MAG: DNA polymerase subunit beta [Spirochaetes bacterium RBG_16_49_21]|nr:MAG: DNA polymerase subunit beta [Spirochaetes bacterium RBG_16_49_21]
MSEKISKILSDFKKELVNIYNDRLIKVILFGSYARGHETDDSDVDILLVLRGKVVKGREIDAIIDVITEISLRYNTLISVIPVSEDDFISSESPLMLNVKKEGYVA